MQYDNPTHMRSFIQGHRDKYQQHINKITKNYIKLKIDLGQKLKIS